MYLNYGYFRYRSLRNIAIREEEYLRSYESSRQELVVQAVKEIKAMRIQCDDDCQRVRDAVRFDGRRADRHAKLDAMKMIRDEKNVRVFVCVCVCVCVCVRKCMGVTLCMYVCADSSICDSFNSIIHYWIRSFPFIAPNFIIFIVFLTLTYLRLSLIPITSIIAEIQKIFFEENKKVSDLKSEKEKAEQEFRDLVKIGNKEKVLKYKTVK